MTLQEEIERDTRNAILFGQALDRLFPSKPWARDPLENPADEQRASATAKELTADMAEVAKAAADWKRLKDEFARLVKLHAVDPDYDLDDSDVAIKSLIVKLQEKIRRNHAQ